ncbi:ABC transporter permease [Nonomuraea zeae]
MLDQGRLVAEGTADELKRRVPGSHVRLRFTGRHELDVAAQVLPESTRDDEELSLRVPGDGGVRSSRALLDRLDVGSTAVAVNSDMTTGFINRLRVMDVSRAAVLNAHVIATMLRSLVAIVFIIGVALLVGFRPSASFVEWLGVIGIVVLTMLAIGWLTVAFGLAAKTPDSAGLAAVPLMLLPFLSSAFVPADTMGPGARQFAKYQPFTPIIETLRGLLTGMPSAGSAIAAVAWCAGLALAGYL